MSIRVLLTHERFPPDFAGGGEYVALRTAAGLQERGARVRVLTTGNPCLKVHEGVTTDRLPVSRYAMNLQVARIAAAAREADVIQTFNYHAALPSLVAARRTVRPVVCGILALFGRAWRSMRGPMAGRAFAAWEKLVVSRAYDRTVFLSAASRAAGLALGAPSDTSLVIAPGIDHARFGAGPRVAPLVVAAGRLDARKGVRHLIAAARALPDIRFRVVGWGDGVSLIRAASLDNLELLEERAGPGYVEALAQGTVFFCPSYAETFGVALVEAMASSCAIVSSVDTVDFAGIATAPGDEAAMITAIRHFCDNPALARAAGDENRRRAAAFTWEAHVDELLALYNELLAQRPAAAVRAT